MSTSAQMLVVPELKDILFATDFSPSSEAVLPFLRSLAISCASTVHVVHVIPPEPEAPVPPDLLDAECSKAEEAIQSLLATDAFREIKHTATVERGDAGEVLLSLAEKMHVGLIVLGTHGRRGLKKLVLGSTAEQVIRTASCPVLTVGPQALREAKAQGKLGPILVALDFDTGQHPAVRFAASLARANQAGLIVLHAVPQDMNVSQANMRAIPFSPDFSAKLSERVLAATRRQMEELIAAEQLQDLEPQLVVEIGAPAEIIVHTAQKCTARLIVMGANRARMHSAAAHIPWAMASAVLCESPCPVMTIRD